MLTFTAAGAVRTPTSVQVRITRSFPGRVAVGAPLPSRDLSSEELSSTLLHFTRDRRGPRTQSCDTLILSGTGLQTRGLAPAVELGRTHGIERVVLHIGEASLHDLMGTELLAAVDEVVVTGTSGLSVPERFPATLTVVVRLDAGTLDELGAVLHAAKGCGTAFTWPSPPAPPPPGAREVVQRLLPHLSRTRGAIKGIPACQFPEAEIPEARLWRSSNRWYVDADHQGSEALTFYPDVVRYEKSDVCRFCRFDTRCDGLIAPWLRAGLYQAPRAV